LGNSTILNEKLAKALADSQEKTCLLNMIEELEGISAILDEKLAKRMADSQNSSKPGSSDLFKGKIKDKAQKNDDVSQKRSQVSYGTHSLAGNRYCETLWSVSETLNKTGQDPLSFFTKALSAYYAGELPPSLVNIGQTVDPKYVKQAEEELKKLDEDKKALAAKKAEAKKKLASAES
jgi:hypothetical protein